jgi:flagellar hook protein FlgE
MNLNCLKNKKILKIVTLLITAAFIATASAEVYNYLNFTAGVGVEGLNLNWDATTIDSGLSANIQGVLCTLTGLKGPAGGTRTYTTAINLTSTAATTFGIEVVSVTTAGGSGTTVLDSIVVRIYDETGNPSTLKGTLDVFSSGSAGTTPVTGLTMTGADSWRLEWDITWASTATTSDSVTVTLKVTTPSP